MTTQEPRSLSDSTPTAQHPPAGPATSRALRCAGIALFLVALAVGAALAGVSFYDWNRARAQVAAQVSRAIGRDVAIHGPLALSWQWPQPLDTTWRRWVPGAIVRVGDVHIGNPPGFPARGPHFAKVGAATAELRLLPLLGRHIDIDRVALTEPDVRLERSADGRNNWTFDAAAPNAGAEQQRWRVTLGHLLLSQGRLSYDDPARQLSVAATLDTLAPDATEKGRYGIGFEFSGWQAKAEVRGRGKAGALLSLRDEQLDFPLQLSVRAGRLGAAAEGSIANPRQLTGVDFQLTVSGGSLADLYPLTGIVLPDTPEFKTSGRLVGTLKPDGAVWDYSAFTGTVGRSDLSGDVRYTSAQPRPQLKGTLKSKLLRLQDLGPVVGAKSNNPDKPARPGKVLPDDPFDTARWDKMDLDLDYTGQRIERPQGVPLDSLRVHAVLANARLTLSPLDFGVAQGRFKSQLSLDARAQPLRAVLRGDVQGLQLSALFPKIELMKKSLGRVDGGVALDARGASVAQLLASANGEARLYVREGMMSQQLLDLAGLNLGSVLVSKLFGSDQEVRLRCAIADLPVRDGVAHLRNVKVNTDDALIEATGNADMRRELFDIGVNPKAYELKLFSLRTPLEVRGPFAQPHVGVQPGPLIVRAAAAVAVLAVAPGALVLAPITVPGAQDDASCAPLLAQGKAAPRAGRPRAAAVGASAPPAAAAPAKPAPPMPAAGELSGPDR